MAFRHRASSNKKRTAADSHVNYCYLTSTEKNERMSQLHQASKEQKDRLQFLRTV